MKRKKLYQLIEKRLHLKPVHLKNVIYVSKFTSTQQNYDLTASKS